MRFIGIDVHRDFCEIASHQAGVTQSIGRINTTREDLQALADSLGPDDWVALETTGNARRIAEILAVNAGGVMVADTRNLRGDHPCQAQERPGRRPQDRGAARGRDAPGRVAL